MHTWTTHANRATNSPYTVYNGVTSLGTVRLNQEMAPNDRTDAGVNWEDLGSGFIITGTTLVVKLTDDANEYVIADGIRIELIGSPLLAAGGPVTGGTVGLLNTAQLQPIVTAAIARLGQQGFDTQLLSTVVFSITDLPGSILGLASPQGISIDVNAAGHGWFVDTTPQDDREFTEGAAPASMMDLLSVVMHELGHTAGLEDHYDADHADDLMAGYLQAGTRHDVGSEHAGSEHTSSPLVTTVPVAVRRVDLFAVSDTADKDISRYAGLQQTVNRLNIERVTRPKTTASVTAETGGADMRQWLGLMTDGDTDNRDLSPAALDQLFLSLLDPDSEFDLNF